MSRVFHLDEPVWIEPAAELAKLRAEIGVLTDALRDQTAANTALSAQATRMLEEARRKDQSLVSAAEEVGLAQLYAGCGSVEYRELCKLVDALVRQLPVLKSERSQRLLMRLEEYMADHPPVVFEELPEEAPDEYEGFAEPRLIRRSTQF